MTTILKATGLESGYGDATVLHGVNLSLEQGEALAILGRNGMGKSTLINTLMGLVKPRKGSIELLGKEIAGLPIHRVARAGMRIVPQGRRVFSSLTVAETIAISGSAKTGEWTPQRVYDEFPSLAKRMRSRADQLSGGEQEMLVIARAILGDPKCLLLDEPSDGLAPKVVEQVAEMVLTLRRSGLSVVLVEQNLQLAVLAADRISCMVRGEMAWEGTTHEFRSNRDIAAEHLGSGAVA
ncbi:ABC transporter ATP-binding protein [Enemella sp. A6]|uniref:ABC transporter ATP-binding protein n=1 Tax=Enemella sp. A6 TaxID=3440152 RepID=UPI003EBA1892